MPIPRLHRPVRGSRTGRPLMAVLDLLGRRWVLRILWELREEPQTFRALQTRCDAISPTVLNRRLGELRAAGLVDHGAGEGYALTPDGRTLLTALVPLAAWADEVRPESTSPVGWRAGGGAAPRDRRVAAGKAGATSARARKR